MLIRLFFLLLLILVPPLSHAVSTSQLTDGSPESRLADYQRQVLSTRAPLALSSDLRIHQYMAEAKRNVLNQEQDLAHDRLFGKLTYLDFMSQLLNENARKHHFNEISQSVPSFLPSDAMPKSCDEALLIDSQGLRFTANPIQNNEKKEQVWWFKLRAPQQHAFALSTKGSTVDARLAVYESCADDEPIQQNDDFFGLAAFVPLHGEPERSYWVEVSAPAMSVGFVALILTEVEGFADLSHWRGQDKISPWLHIWNDKGWYQGSMDLSEPTEIPLLLPKDWLFSEMSNQYAQRGLATTQQQCSGLRCYSLAELGNNINERVLLPNPVSNEFGDLVGRVINTDSKSVVEARVSVFDKSGTVIASRYVNRQGYYRFNDLPAGNYRVMAEAEGFYQSNVNGNYCVLGRDACDLSQVPETEIRHESVTRHNLSLQLQASISGSVFDEEGRRRGFSQLQLYRDGVIVQQVTSDYLGHYVLTIVEPGTYVVVADSLAQYQRTTFPNIPCPDGDCADDGAQAIVVAAEQSIAGIDFSLPFNSSVSGVIVDTDGEPLVGARLSFFNVNGDLRQQAFTDADGRWQYTVENNGPLLIVAESDSHVAVINDGTVCAFDTSSCDLNSALPIIVLPDHSEDINFQLPRKSSIRGIVNVADSNILSARVNAHLENDDVVSTAFVNRLDGTYELFVPAGETVRIAVSALSHQDQVYPSVDCNRNCDVQLGDPFVLSPSQVVDNVDFDLLSFQKLRGRITQNGVAGKNNQGFRLSLHDAESRQVISQDRLVLDENGGYEVSFFADGRYIAVLDSEDNYTAVYKDITCQAVRLSSCDLSQAMVLVSDGGDDIENIDFDVVVGARMTGVISGQENRRRTLVIYNAEDQAVASETLNSGPYEIFVPSSGVHYAVLRTRFNTDLIYDGMSCIEQECTLRDGTPIDIPLGSEVNDINFDLTAIDSRFLGGQIRTPSNASNNAVYEISLWDEEGVFLGEHRHFPLNGDTFRIGPLNKERFFVSVSRFGYQDQVYPGVPCEMNDCDVTQGELVNLRSHSQFDVDFDLKFVAFVSGRVTTARSGNSVRGATVRIVDLDNPFRLAFTTTDDQGRYTLSSFRPGRYAFIADLAAFQRPFEQLYPGILCNPRCDLDLAEEFIIDDVGHVFTNIDFQLTFPGRIQGTVSRFPVTAESEGGVTIRLLNLEGRTVRQDVVRTADDRFTFDVRDPGLYLLHASGGGIDGILDFLIDCPYLAPSIDCDINQGHIISVEHDGFYPVNFDLGSPSYGGISGLVAADSAAQLSGAEILLYSEDLRLLKTQSLPFGSSAYDFQHVPTGRYYVAAKANDHVQQFFDGQNCLLDRTPQCNVEELTAVQVLPGSTTPQIDFSLQENTELFVNLVDANTQTPIVGEVSLGLFNDRQQLVQSQLSTQGQATFSNIPHGNYFLTATSQQAGIGVSALYNAKDCLNGFFAGCSIDDGDVISVALETSNSIDFNVNTLASVQLNVATDDGNPVTRGRAVIFDTEGNRRQINLSTTHVISEVVFDNVAPGEYSLLVEGTDRFIDEIYDDIHCEREDLGGCDLSLATLFTVGYNDVLDLNMALDSSAIFSGRVISTASNEGIDGATVMLIDLQGEVIDTSTTDEQGEYVFSRVYPGEYHVFSTHPDLFAAVYPAGKCLDGTVSSCPLNEAQVITVQLGENQDIGDFSLFSFPRIRGQLSARNGEEASNAEVILFNANGSVINRSEIVGEQFDIASRGPGTYYLGASFTAQASRSALGVPTVYSGLDCPGGLSRSCPVTTATAITVIDEDIQGLDLTFTNYPQIAFMLKDAVTGDLIPQYNALVSVYNRFFEFMGTRQITEVSNNINGSFQLDQPGEYYLFVENENYGNTAYPGQLCESDLFSCDFSRASTISIDFGLPTPVEFNLHLIRGISGRVTAFPDGLPLPGVPINVWTFDRQFVGTATSNENGAFNILLEDSVYLIETDIEAGFINEIYDDIVCDEENINMDICSFNFATGIQVDSLQTTVVPEVIAIELLPDEVIFLNDFESRN